MPERAAPEALLAAWRQRVDTALDAALTDQTVAPRRLHAAMRHAALLGGKRIRPLLVYATGAALGADTATLDGPACAVELVHAYSLVHDDLPAMDDDALRRGQPTVHVAFDEATAILAGDALQTLAFAQLAESPLDAGTRIAMVAELAAAAGATGMCGGQALDIDATARRSVPRATVSTAPQRGPGMQVAPKVTIDQVEHLHALKTGALLRCAVRFGAIAAGADANARAALDRYADALGLAFQIRDDLLDVEGDSNSLGKTAGKDALQDKATFPALLGLDASRARLRQYAEAMDDALDQMTVDSRTLRFLARGVVERQR